MKRMLRSSLLATLGLLAGFVLAFYGEPKPRVQTLNFDHSKHQPLACRICHSGVFKQERAIVPSTELCAKCHAVSPDTSSAGMEMWRQAEKVVTVRWPVSFALPTHVYFSHRRHAANANIQCETCHGNMTEQKTPVTSPFRVWKMDDCLACHEQQKVTDDCAQCHR